MMISAAAAAAACFVLYRQGGPAVRRPGPLVANSWWPRGGRIVLPLTVLLATCCLPARGDAAESPPRPNIVWITAEDMSPTLGCYGDAFAQTPEIDALARQSTKYSHAFATAPVCSPSRACLINGCIATRQGTHAMRSRFPLPERMRGFPSWLREAGYYTTNNVKTDYNSAAEPRIIASAWDESSATAHWRNRPEGKPFFSVFNLMTTHQSRTMVWPYEQFVSEVQSELSPTEISDPAEVPLPPYYPDTAQVRKTVARFYDCVQVMDRQVGKLLSELEQAGVAENTIVFFYADHGSGMPRHKRALFDSGMRVPLLIRFPKKYRHLAPSGPDTWTDRLVSFEDFGPTVLSLAGVERIPDFMRGRSFLGPRATPPRQFVFGHRDRVDEILDTARSVRSHDYLYIRNYMPHRGYNQQSAWIDQGAIRGAFAALAESGEATPAQAQYLRPWRPREELYDCRRDPLNLRNLADSPAHQSQLRAMRKTLRDELIQTRDLGFVPEIELARQTEGTTPYEWSRQRPLPIEPLLSAASLVGTQRFAAIRRALADARPAIRYWGATAGTAAERLPAQLREALQRALDDPSPAVQIEAATALASHGETEAAYATFRQLLESDDQTVLLYTARAIELLADPVHREAMQRLADRFAEAPGDMAWFIRFSTSGYLSRLD